MPVTFNALTASLDATIIDGNFKELQRFLHEQFGEININDASINRYVVRRYTSGRIRGVNIRTNEMYLEEDQAAAQRRGTFDLTNKFLTTVFFGYNLYSWPFAPMEFLGIPGPSFYFDYQEQAYVPEPIGVPVVNRFKKDFCYSRWLTIPGCSIKLYVPHPCIVRMSSMVNGIMNMFYAMTFRSITGVWNPATDGNEYAVRLGLFVDTNPVLHPDEFPNTNPYILTAAGGTAPFVSWKEVERQSIRVTQSTIENISGEVALKGGRWYNFSVKMRDAFTFGYNSAGLFVGDRYEGQIALPAQFNGTDARATHTPPYEALWNSTSLDLDFNYGRDTAWVNDITNSEFTSVP